MTDTTTVIEALERAPQLVLPLVRETPASIRTRRPAPGKWSVHEHACHLADVHRIFFGRLDQLLTETNPQIVPFDPKDQPEDRLLNMDLEESLKRFELDRKTLVSRLRELAPSDWERMGRHPEFQPYSILILFRHLAFHDLFHAYRIEELALRPEWPRE